MRCTLKRKIKDIRYKYGTMAVEYFLLNNVCELCSENRLVVLNIHHVYGKNFENFKTLCFNCHMLEHNKEREFDTFLSCKKTIMKKKSLIKKKI